MLSMPPSGLWAIYAFLQAPESIEAPNAAVPTSLRNGFEALVKKITEDLFNLPFPQQVKEVSTDLLNLRIECLKWITGLGDNADLFMEFVLNEIAHLNKQVDDKNLRLSLDKSFEIVNHITRVIAMPMLTNNDPAQQQQMQDIRIDYQLLRGQFAALGFDQSSSDTMIDFIDSSLSVEYALLVAELFYSTPDRPKVNLEDLSNFLFENAQRYGAYSIVLKIWKPTPADLENNELLGCQILSQVIELERHDKNINFDLSNFQNN